jgi:hypothetical protein
MAAQDNISVRANAVPKHPTGGCADLFSTVRTLPTPALSEDPMTERRQLPLRYSSVASRPRRRSPAAGALHPETVSAPPAMLAPDEPATLPPDEPTILGFPAELPDAEPTAEDQELAAEPLVPAAAADHELFVLRSSDASAGAFLMVAGAAGGMSLFLPWVQNGRQLGLDLVQRALDSAGVTDMERSGLILPMAVAFGGGVLFLLGLLAFWPARSHRFIGVLALFVALAVAAGIVVRVADLGWDPLRTDPGFLCAVVLAGAGTLGALKAMLTPPEFTTDPRTP